jgi:mono/diheme cytochrome c family protein
MVNRPVGIGAPIVTAIVVGAVMLGCGEDERIGLAKPPDPPEKSLPGMDKFQKFCQKCHGANGKGTDARGELPTIPDFTSAAWQKERSDARLLVSVLEGKGTKMPAFNDRLTKDEAKDLIAIVRTFKPSDDKPPK